jgi:hypothetical protein
VKGSNPRLGSGSVVFRAGTCPRVHRLIEDAIYPRGERDEIDKCGTQ